MTSYSWDALLPPDLGLLPFGGRLIRTEPTGPTPAAVAFVGIYPALVRIRRHRRPDGKTELPVPVEVERHSFSGSSSGKELDDRYLARLGLRRDQVFFIDLYPYYLANTARSPDSGRSMWDNVQLYAADTREALAVKPRPEPDAMLSACRSLPGNAERLASWFERCKPGLVVTLGNEVAAFARKLDSARAAQQHLYAPAVDTDAFGPSVKVVHCAHPGVFTRRSEDNPWEQKHADWCAGPGRALVEAAVATTG